MENSYVVVLNHSKSKETFRSTMTFGELQAYIAKKEFLANKDSVILHEMTGNIQFSVIDRKDRNWIGTATIIKN